MIKLATQVVDVHVEDVGLGNAQSPNLLDQHSARHAASCFKYQLLKQGVLAVGKRDGATFAHHETIDAVQREIIEDNYRTSCLDAAAQHSLADVVGPVCETGDTFARQRALPPLQPQARVAILDTGAYGSVMSSTYNARPLAAQVLVDGGQWAVIRARQPVEALWAGEIIPDWLTP